MQVREAQSALLDPSHPQDHLRDWGAWRRYGAGPSCLRSARKLAPTAPSASCARPAGCSSGIVPRNELDDLEQQASQQRMDLEAARREVESTRAQEQGENRQIAENGPGQRKREIRDATGPAWMAVRCAPFAGIVVARRPGWRQGGREPVQAGNKLGAGARRCSAWPASAAEGICEGSELDINQLREGQAVEISGDGFEGTTLAGVIAALGGQALPGMARGGSPQFGDGIGSAARSPPVAERFVWE